MSKRTRPAAEPGDDDVALLLPAAVAATLADLVYMDNGMLLEFFLVGRLYLRDLAAMARADKALGLRMATLTPDIVQRHPDVPAVVRTSIKEAAALGKVQDWSAVLQWLPEAVVFDYMLFGVIRGGHYGYMNIHALVSLECARIIGVSGEGMNATIQYLRLRVLATYFISRGSIFRNGGFKNDVPLWKAYEEVGEKLGLPRPPRDFFWSSDEELAGESPLMDLFMNAMTDKQTGVKYDAKWWAASRREGATSGDKRQSRYYLHALVAVGYYDDFERSSSLGLEDWDDIFQVNTDSEELLPFYGMTPARMNLLLNNAAAVDSNYDNLISHRLTLYANRLSLIDDDGLARPDLQLIVVTVYRKEYEKRSKIILHEWMARLCLPDAMLHELSAFMDPEETFGFGPADINAAKNVLDAIRANVDNLMERLRSHADATSAVGLLQRALTVWPRFERIEDDLVMEKSLYVHAYVVFSIMANVVVIQEGAKLAPVMPALRRLLLQMEEVDKPDEPSRFDILSTRLVHVVRDMAQYSPEMIEVIALLSMLPMAKRTRQAIKDIPLLEARVAAILPRTSAQRWAGELRAHGAIAPHLMPQELTPDEQQALVDTLNRYINDPAASSEKLSIFATVPHPDVLLRVFKGHPMPTRLLGIAIVCELVNNPAITRADQCAAFLCTLSGAASVGAIADLRKVDVMLEDIWIAGVFHAPKEYVYAMIPYVTYEHPARDPQLSTVVFHGSAVQWNSLVVRQLMWTEVLITGNVRYMLRGPPVIRFRGNMDRRDRWLHVHLNMLSEYLHFTHGPRLQALGTTGARLAISNEIGRAALTALHLIFVASDPAIMKEDLRFLLGHVDPEDATDPHEFGPLAQLVAQMVLETLLRVIPAGAILQIVTDAAKGEYYSPAATFALLEAALRESRGIELADETRTAIRASMREIESDDESDE